ncbi:MAG: spore maturation protein [Firmicutes bacterium]|nr:spore maturation protein [Bacillota bacterium]
MISNYILPLIVLFILIHAIYKKIDVYDTFVEGAKESFEMTLKLFPCLLAMVLAVNIFIKSNIIANLFGFITFIPNEIIPMILTRPISGTSSLAVLTNIYETLGPDGYIGTLASFIQGSTDTTFYIITLYFGSVGIKKIKYAMWAGLFADLLSVIFSIIMVNILF